MTAKKSEIYKNTFTTDEVIKILDWLRKSKYHSQGFNGWNQYGCSAYYGVSSYNVLNDAVKQLKLNHPRGGGKV